MSKAPQPWALGDALTRGLNEPIAAGAQAAEGDNTYVGGGGGGYDAANNSPARSILSFPTNSFSEFSTQTRTQLVQKARALAANLPLCGRIAQKIGQHSVGKGIFVRPATKDTEWNDLARALFEDWASHPGVYSIDAGRDHYEDQRIAAETMVLDGEYFAALVNSPAGAPMIQPLDVFEIRQPWGGRNVSTADYFDGVRTNAFNRPSSYAVAEFTKNGSMYGDSSTREVAAENMLHIFRRKRAKQLRGLTWFHSGINKGIDALDLAALITGTAKLHSGLAVNVTGSGPVKSRGAISKIAGEGSVATDDYRGLERVYGGGIISYLGEKGKVELLSSDRPSENLMEFLRYLSAEFAQSAGLKLQAVDDMSSLGGATAREALQDAQWLFDMVQDAIIWRHSFPIYRWRISRFIKEGRLRPCRDPYWWATSWRGPAKLTVDMGRTAQANVLLLKNGGLTHGRMFNEAGMEVRDEWGTQIEDLAWLDRRCLAAGIDPARIIEKTAENVTNINVPEK